jgi:hypothetical protein
MSVVETQNGFCAAHHDGDGIAVVSSIRIAPSMFRRRASSDAVRNTTSKRLVSSTSTDGWLCELLFARPLWAA